MSGIILTCMGCERLGDCATVDEEKLLSGFYCGDWREAHQAKVAARQQVLYKFGSTGAQTLLNRPPVLDEKEE